MFDLSGKVALVTGSGSGIGQQTAHTLAGLGAQVFATDINHEGAAATAAAVGGTATALGHDVTAPEDWARVVARVQDRAGRLDILVNNAGIMVNRPFLETTLAEYRHQQAVNVESVFLGMQAALPLMLMTASTHNVSPSIINISSVYGQVAGATFSAYSASKGAVRLLSKAVAYEFARTGVRVNSIHPGPTATNLGAGWEPPRDAAGNPLSPEEAAAVWLNLIPNGRFGMPTDIAAAIAFLASDASAYMTGSELTIDGGYTAV
ncbi:MAG: glucose 1-dehydrogenase [Alphaproteobacteria bacterium]|nr:glucose 1-dehydrogenase [Alphaproteobacteria bacterium]